MSESRKLPGSLETNRALNQWLRIDPEGTITVRPGKVEIGQGILTALVQIVAEELDVSPSRIRLVRNVDHSALATPGKAKFERKRSMPGCHESS